MNIVRKPESQRGPQLARSAKATAGGIRRRGRRPPGVTTSGPGPGSLSASRTRVPSPVLESTRAGSRIAQIVATTKTTNA